ncbi:hypothetical protein ACTVP2_22075 (plasmid) [Serratia marcescens]|uniref:hypothetical protein n=1 Tax=Serratia marcescens TaxID=615 RepID=UPI003FA6E53F
MQFENVNFNGKCYVHLLIGEYGEVGGMAFTGKDSLSILAGLFKNSHDFQSIFNDRDTSYLTGFVDPGDKVFQKFMLDNVKITKERDEELYAIDGFYHQSSDFWDVWEDNDIEEVRVSFPII